MKAVKDEPVEPNFVFNESNNQLIRLLLLLFRELCNPSSAHPRKARILTETLLLSRSRGFQGKRGILIWYIATWIHSRKLRASFLEPDTHITWCAIDPTELEKDRKYVSLIHLLPLLDYHKTRSMNLVRKEAQLHIMARNINSFLLCQNVMKIIMDPGIGYPFTKWANGHLHS